MTTWTPCSCGLKILPCCAMASLCVQSPCMGGYLPPVFSPLIYHHTTPSVTGLKFISFHAPFYKMEPCHVPTSNFQLLKTFPFFMVQIKLPFSWQAFSAQNSPQCLSLHWTPLGFLAHRLPLVFPRFFQDARLCADLYSTQTPPDPER